MKPQMETRRTRKPRRAWAVALVLLAGGAGPALGSAPARPTLVVALYGRVADRPALRRNLAGAQARRLADWRAKGLLAGYRLLFSRYADAGAWDGLEVLTFSDEAALARWRSVEREAPGGLSVRGLSRVTQMVSTPADMVRRNAPPSAAPSPVVLVIPYQALVSTPDYLGYLDGYTLPQFEGWMRAGGLEGYAVTLSRYPADRPWQALIFLRFRDDQALGRREATAETVRHELARDPAWAAARDTKKAVRMERAAVVADQLAAGGDAP